MTRLHPLVAALRALTAATPVADLAAAIDVSPNTVYKWAVGGGYPTVPLLARWAVVAKRRLAVVDGDVVLAEGEEIASALPRLRRSRGYTQQEIADARQVNQSTIAAHDLRGFRYLVPTDEYVTAIGARLVLLEAS